MTELENAAAGKDARPPTAAYRFDRLLGVMTQGTAQVCSTSDALLAGASKADLERVLYAANERWKETSREPMTPMEPLEYWRNSISALLRDGSPIGRMTWAIHTALAGPLALRADTRDASTIAEQFLAKVEGLSRLHGEQDMDRHLERARDDLLGGVPKRYQAQVLERMLDLEEARAAPEDREDLKASREERQRHALRVLLGGGKRER